MVSGDTRDCEDFVPAGVMRFSERLRNITMNVTLNPSTQIPSTPGAPTQSAADTLAFELFQKQAEAKIDEVVNKFVATAFFYPILQQLGDSPFKTAMFDGGFTQDAFQSRLNLRMADELASSSRLSLSNVLGQKLRNWLGYQSQDKIKDIAQRKGFDVRG